MNRGNWGKFATGWGKFAIPSTYNTYFLQNYPCFLTFQKSTFPAIHVALFEKITYAITHISDMLSEHTYTFEETFKNDKTPR